VVLTAYGAGPLAAELGAAPASAHAGYAETARYLREEYAPRATEDDAVGAERYAIAARQSLGADLNLADGYGGGWEELRRIEAEMAREADRVRPGADVDEATALLEETRRVAGADAYHA